MSKKETEKVRLHNRGKREITLKNGVKSVPNRAVSVPSEIADFYIKAYPQDFILFEDLEATKKAKKDVKNLESENKKLLQEKADLEARLAELEGKSGKKSGEGGDTGGGE